MAAALSVLIVDDHEPMRTLLRRVLERAGAEVREAEHGAAALALLAERGAALVICDRAMPGMNGAELVRAVRADPAHAQTRILMLTGHAGAAIAEEARAAGVDAVLVKPLAPSALLKAIAELAIPAARAASRS